MFYCFENLISQDNAPDTTDKSRIEGTYHNIYLGCILILTYYHYVMNKFRLFCFSYTKVFFLNPYIKKYFIFIFTQIIKFVYTDFRLQKKKNFETIFFQLYEQLYAPSIVPLSFFG